MWMVGWFALAFFQLKLILRFKITEEQYAKLDAGPRNTCSKLRDKDMKKQFISPRLLLHF